MNVSVPGIEQIVAQEGEVERHRQRHDHPQEEDDDRGRHRESRQTATGLPRCHAPAPRSARSNGVEKSCPAEAGQPSRHGRRLAAYLM